MPISATNLLTEFNTRYETKYGRKAYFNSWHYTLAGRIGKFYTPGEMKRALDFYFDTYGEHSVQFFCDHIDVIMHEYDTTLESNKRNAELVAETKRRMEEIYNGKFGSSSNNKNN